MLDNVAFAPQRAARSLSLVSKAWQETRERDPILFLFGCFFVCSGVELSLSLLLAAAVASADTATFRACLLP